MVTPLPYVADITLKNTHKSLLGVASTTGVYVYKQGGVPIYIGKAVNLKARLLSHKQNAAQNAKEEKIVSGADSIDLIYTDSEFLALVLEARLISSIKPKYNVRWRDDKTHLYIKITIKDTYPKVFMTRRENDGKSRYFGPFDSVRSVESLLKQLRRIVPYCTQKNIRKGSCFYHKIGLCNPCPNLIEQEPEPLKTQHHRQYRSQIKTLIRILDGKTDIVFRTLHQSIRTLTKENRYEEAITARDASKQLELLIMYGRFVDGAIHGYNQSEQAIIALRTTLLPHFPALEKLHRIECYDNSTLGFQHSTAGMVVLTDGIVDKKEYRKFKLKTNSNNDFDMMKEAIARRAENARWAIPDLIVLDGGKPQVRAVMEMLRAKALHLGNRENFSAIPLIGLAKNPDRIVVGVEGLPTIRPPRHDLGYRLLQLLRDEAHRFSKKYHTYLRTKAEMVQ